MTAKACIVGGAGTGWQADDASIQTWTLAAPGGANTVLVSDGTNWIASTVSLTAGVGGVLPVANGGAGSFGTGTNGAIVNLLNTSITDVAVTGACSPGLNGKMLVSIAVPFNCNTSSSQITWTIQVDGVTQDTVKQDIPVDALQNKCFSYDTVYSVSVATHTYKLRGQMTGFGDGGNGNQVAIAAGKCRISAIPG